MGCSCETQYENLDSIDYDSFKQFIQLLVDQGLLLSNGDVGTDIMSLGTSHVMNMPVRFESQLLDIQAAVADMLEARPVCQKLADCVAANSNPHVRTF